MTPSSLTPDVSELSDTGDDNASNLPAVLGLRLRLLPAAKLRPPFLTASISIGGVASKGTEAVLM